MNPQTRLYLKIAERVAWTFVQAYLSAVVLLPGDIWDPLNWKIGLGGAVLSTVKNVAASRLSGLNSPATLPASVTAVGGVVGQVTGAVLSDTGEVLGEVTGIVGGTLEAKPKKGK